MPLTFKAVVAGTLAIAWFTAFSPTAHAVFPGSNGKIAVITEYYDGPCDDCGPEGQRAWILDRGRVSASFPALSIAFSAGGSSIAYETYGGGVWTARADGSHRRLVSRNGNELAAPAWRPAGATIAYGGGSGVTRASATGAEKRVLAPRSAWELAWNPAGTQVAFTTTSDVEVVGAEGEALQSVFHDPRYDQPIALDWSASGWLSFKSRGRLLLLSSGATRPQVAVRGLEPQDDRPYFDYSWAPDGRRLAFSRSNGLWVMRVPDGSPRRVSRTSGMPLQWSPDGRLIAFVRGRRIFTASVSGGRTRLFGHVNDRRSGQEYIADLEWQARRAHTATASAVGPRQ